MRVVGADHISSLSGELDAAASAALVAWLAEVRQADWRTMADLVAIYPTATVEGRRVSFAAAGGRIRISTIIAFDVPIVLITEARVLLEDTKMQRRRS